MRSQIAPLTSLRFFAAMLVVCHHLMDYSLAPIHLEIINRGGLAVDFFFILSGYILMHAYGQQASRGDDYARRFIVARFAKIYPVHLVVLLLLLAFVVASKFLGVAVNENRYSTSSFFANLLLLNAWGVTDQMTWNFPAWSISAEWAAYLLFPALISLQRNWPAKTALLVLAAGWLVFGSWLHLATRTVDFGVARILPEFLGGMLLYRALPPTKALPRADAQFLAAAVLIVAGLSLGVADVWFALAFAWIIAAAPGLSGWPGRVLSHRALVRLGDESYSLYMVHVFVFTILFGALRTQRFSALASAPHLVDLLAIAAALVAASLSYRLIETPAQTWIRDRLLHKPSSVLASRNATG